MNVMVFCAVRPCSMVDTYKRFCGTPPSSACKNLYNEIQAAVPFQDFRTHCQTTCSQLSQVKIVIITAVRASNVPPKI
jgi:hypothetical protein